ncbi:MAG: cobalamin-dependent protein, partial [Clostridia bacterium]|nr:cobalamin-dependent protein [Clostridia bacterium]
MLLAEKAPLELINCEIIPALDHVGKGYEEKTVYLPQLLMSAEAAKAAFEKIKENSAAKTDKIKCDFVLATVFGDIHDIGKNIVKLLLENYGFSVIDLGKDVPPEKIADEVVKKHAPLCGLSALMTTTVPAMEKTVALIKRLAPWCKVAVGGAVLTKEYADRMGADKFAKDAMETVRYAEKIYKELG